MSSLHLKPIYSMIVKSLSTLPGFSIVPFLHRRSFPELRLEWISGPETIWSNLQFLFCAFLLLRQGSSEETQSRNIELQNQFSHFLLNK